MLPFYGAPGATPSRMSVSSGWARFRSAAFTTCTAVRVQSISEAQLLSVMEQMLAQFPFEIRTVTSGWPLHFPWQSSENAALRALDAAQQPPRSRTERSPRIVRLCLL
jgi:hypothetical protein